MRQRATVFFDRDCGFCQRSVALVRRLDWVRALRFVPLQDKEAAALGLPESETLSQMVLAKGGRAWGGWRAVKQIFWRIPLFWSGWLAMAIAAATIVPLRLPIALFAGLLCVALSPIGNPLGDRLYRWIARNRQNFPGSTCSIENR
jgi:predicted DCC family thiol-disulfide oxidoreductase YuxK